MEEVFMDFYKVVQSKDDVDKKKVEEGVRIVRRELWKIFEVSIMC